jgi:hypothetical protein
LYSDKSSSFKVFNLAPGLRPNSDSEICFSLSFAPILNETGPGYSSSSEWKDFEPEITQNFKFERIKILNNQFNQFQTFLKQEFFFVYVDIESGSIAEPEPVSVCKVHHHFGGAGADTRCRSSSNGSNSKLDIQHKFQFLKI